MQKDIEKLLATRARVLMGWNTIRDCGNPQRFILLLSQGEAYGKLAGIKSENHDALARMLKLALKREPPRRVYRSVVETYLVEETHWSATAFARGAKMVERIVGRC